MNNWWNRVDIGYSLTNKDELDHGKNGLDFGVKLD